MGTEIGFGVAGAVKGGAPSVDSQQDYILGQYERFFASEGLPLVVTTRNGTHARGEQACEPLKCDPCPD